MTDAAADLCKSCQLCCNGGFFPKVRISAAEAARLEQHLPGICGGSDSGLPQPCIALHPKDGCTIYHLRPNGCRKFTCALLHRVEQGDIGSEVAFGTIEQAKALRSEVDYGNGEAVEAAKTAYKKLIRRHFLPR